MAKRKGISKKTRFEVFKRDSFKCQYCGLSAPQVILNVDHIHPVADGGDDDLMNLVTSCWDCNSGKSDRLLDDNSAISKQKAQLDELEERRQQIEMMMEWKTGLSRLNDDLIDNLADRWSELAVGWSVSEQGRKGLKKLVKKYGFQDVYDAIETAATSYLRYGLDGKATLESVQFAFQKIGGVCFVTAKTRENPELPRLYRIRTILRSRVYVNEQIVMRILVRATELGASVPAMEKVAMNCSNWTQFREVVEKFIAEREAQNPENLN